MRIGPAAAGVAATGVVTVAAAAGATTACMTTSNSCDCRTGLASPAAYPWPAASAGSTRRPHAARQDQRQRPSPSTARTAAAAAAPGEVGQIGVDTAAANGPPAAAAVPQGVHGRLARRPPPSPARPTRPAGSAGSAAGSGSPRPRSTRRPVSDSGPRGRLAPAAAGRTVNQNVDPRPASLSTPIVPPISPASCRLMASPSPVPPYLRVVLASTWLNDWNSRSSRSGGMPMPVSVTAKRTPSAAAAGVGRHGQRDRPGVGELHGVAEQVDQHLADAVGRPRPAPGTAGSTSHATASPLAPPGRQHGHGLARPRRPGRTGRPPARACRPRSWRSPGCR